MEIKVLGTGCPKCKALVVNDKIVVKGKVPSVDEIVKLIAQ